jgi:hypothetical protein
MADWLSLYLNDATEQWVGRGGLEGDFFEWSIFRSAPVNPAVMPWSGIDMPASHFTQRLSYFFLCSGPFLAIVLVAIRLLRVPGVHEVIGVAVFAMFAIATWMLGFRGITSHQPEKRLAAIAATLLISPFALISLLWVGLGPPWLASPAENQMRYVVLVTSAAAVVSGCVTLKEALSVAGERFYSTLGFAGMILAGPLYLIGEAFLLAAFSAVVRTGQAPDVFHSLSELQDILLFFGGVLTYAATVAFAVSLYKAGWLGRGASRAFVGASFVALLCLVTRGLQFPDPEAPSMPWYAVPGFIAGIPAVPFIIPYLLGVVSLRHSNREEA